VANTLVDIEDVALQVKQTQPSTDLERANSSGGFVLIKEWRRGWRAGVAALIGTGTGLSVWPIVSSLFIQPLQFEFGWTRSQVVLAYNASLAVAVAAPVIGRRIDRVGIRKVLLSSILLTAIGYAGLAALPRSLGLFYALYLYTTTIGIGTSGLGFSRVASAAFVRTRGLALAVSRLGLGVSSIILPPMMFALIHAHGWRAGFVLLAALLVLVTFPISYFFVDRPHKAPTRDAGKNGDVDQNVSWKDGLRRPQVWILCFAAALSFAPAVSILQQLQPILMSKGIAAPQAAALIGIMGLATVSGTFITGVLTDRVWAPLIGGIFTLGPALGCILLLQTHVSTAMATTALVGLGLAQGAEFDLVAYMIARYFGLGSYATIYGITTFFIAGGCALYANLLGRMYDNFGSYERGIVLCGVSLVLATACYLAMGRYPQRAE
jgi:predicted MFS family arabinose efflux permease